jgi:hypothetical protein
VKDSVERLVGRLYFGERIPLDPDLEVVMG